jgi:hypothetical protein
MSLDPVLHKQHRDVLSQRAVGDSARSFSDLFRNLRLPPSGAIVSRVAGQGRDEAGAELARRLIYESGRGLRREILKSLKGRGKLICRGNLTFKALKASKARRAVIQSTPGRPRTHRRRPRRRQQGDRGAPEGSSEDGSGDVVGNLNEGSAQEHRSHLSVIQDAGRPSVPIKPPAQVDFIQGDAADILAKVAAESVDGVVTDPPHGVLPQLAWDVLPTVDFWCAVNRVLKPGAPLIVIGASRTYDLMVHAIRQAGFEVEEMGVWVFATGRPRSLNHLKRAHAPILFARKPGRKVPVNIEEGRLPFVDEEDRKQTRRVDTLRV